MMLPAAPAPFIPPPIIPFVYVPLVHGDGDPPSLLVGLGVAAFIVGTGLLIGWLLVRKLKN